MTNSLHVQGVTGRLNWPRRIGSMRLIGATGPLKARG